MGCKYVKEFDFGPAKVHVAGYCRGGPVKKADGGKVERVMGEFGKGQLHSGSKSGPIVKNEKQAIAIALNAARKK